MAKKILIFSLAYYPHVGGAEVAIKEITDRLSPEEFEFHMVTNRYDSTLPRIEQVGNVLVHRIGLTTKKPSMGDLGRFPLHFNKLFFQYFAYRKACRLHRQHHYDGVWAMMAHATGVPAALFKRRFPDVPYVLTLQEGDPPEYIEKKMRVFGSLFTHAFTTADIIQPISNFLGAWAKRMGSEGEVVVIPNAVDTLHFRTPAPEGELGSATLHMGKTEEKTFLITTSRLVYKNAIDDVVRALPLLPASVHFAILGDGPEHDALEILANMLGVRERVHFLGHVDRSAMPAYLQSADIFIRPSRSEGLGISFLEAMAAGLPVIATHEGGIPDFLSDAGKNPEKPPTGFVVTKDSPEDIARVVTYVLVHPEARDIAIGNARKLIEERYEWNKVAGDMRTRIFSKIQGR